MVNAITIVFIVISLFCLGVGLYVTMPKSNEKTDVWIANAKIAQVWMLASAIMLAVGFLLKS
jgi:hypothetical protein